MKFVNIAFLLLAATENVSSFSQAGRKVSVPRSTSTFTGQSLTLSSHELVSNSASLSMIAADIANGQKAKRTRQVRIVVFNNLCKLRGPNGFCSFNILY